jgi:hypothetical protein
VANQNELSYSILSIVDERQLDAITILPDWKWRLRNEEHLIQAKPAKDIIEPLSVEYIDAERVQFDYLNSGLVNLVSAELADFLKARANVELLPITGTLNGQPYIERRFYIIHLLDRFSALDPENSIYSEYSAEAGGGIKSVQKLAIDRQKVSASPMFMLDELAVLCVRNDLKQELREAQFSGLCFRSTETFKL